MHKSVNNLKKKYSLHILCLILLIGKINVKIIDPLLLYVYRFIYVYLYLELFKIPKCLPFLCGSEHVAIECGHNAEKKQIEQ